MLGHRRARTAAAGLGDPRVSWCGRRGVSGHRLGPGSHVADHDRDLSAVVGGLLLTAMLPLLGSRLPRTRRLWAVGVWYRAWQHHADAGRDSVIIDRAGVAVAAVLRTRRRSSLRYARFALDEPITRLRAAGLVVGFGGVLLVVLADPGSIAHGSRLAIGLALCLVGALGWAAGGVAMRVLTQRDSDLDVVGITAAQFLAGGVPLIPLVLLAGGSTDWSRPSLIAQLAYLIIGGQLLVYVGFNAALSRWPSTRVYAWTFLVPVVAVLVEAVRGALPGASAMVGIALVIVGVAIVNHPRAEPYTVEDGQQRPALDGQQQLLSEVGPVPPTAEVP